ncbi:MAG: hypothetical protein LBC84_09165 [Prevotellaceae bacterium]|jgi:hypothetical protein|nr:hypothetical protein [Prevotellaceae bacterium]
MKDKIIVLLTAKFAGARKDTLAQIARTLAMQATTEEQAQALVDTITDEQVTEFEREYRAEVDKEVTAGQKAFEAGLKKKFDIVEKKKTPEEAPKIEPQKADESANKDEAPSWVKAIFDDLKKVSDELSSIKSADTRKSRRQVLEEALGDVNSKIKAKTLKDFEVMNFVADEDFNAYIEGTKADIAEIKQEFVNQGLSATEPPKKSGGQPSKEASEKECDAITEHFKL